MSDHDMASDAEPDLPSCMRAIRLMKADIDVILMQLRSGQYASPDTFVNNWEHLIQRVLAIKPLLNQPGVTDLLVCQDKSLMTDLLAITHAVALVGHFLACIGHQAER